MTTPLLQVIAEYELNQLSVMLHLSPTHIFINATCMLMCL